MPIDDPQFWIVTFLALAASAVLIKMAWPKRSKHRRTTLTVSAKKHEG